MQVCCRFDGAVRWPFPEHFDFEPVSAEGRCLIAQQGYDGFGHQYHGKLSCQLAEKTTHVFKYLHAPFTSNDAHGGFKSEEAELFTQIRANFPLESDYNQSYTRVVIGGESGLENWMRVRLNKLLAREEICDPYTIYFFDNCWGHHNISAIAKGSQQSVE